MIAQGVLPYEYQEQSKKRYLTGFAGLAAYLDLAAVAGICESIRTHIRVRSKQGWDDVQMILSLMLLNLAGGDCVEDIRLLEADEGFCRLLRRVQHHGLRRRQRRALERRWRKQSKRTFPSPSAIFRFLAKFHDPTQETMRQAGRAFIPAANEHLRGLAEVNASLIAFLQSRDPAQTATLDEDACLAETSKKDALYSYKEFKAYQPLNIYWTEQDALLHSEFRDGNVPAGYQVKRVLQEALDHLPEGVKKVLLRSDTAGYQHELLEYCEKGLHPRFGRIEFAISCDVTPEFKMAVAEVKETEWRPIYRQENGIRMKTDRQWAEVCFIPNKIAFSKNAPCYRFLATREEIRQLPLPGMEMQQQLPFQTLEMNDRRYKIFGIVTNIGHWSGEEIIHWLNARCGKSEQAHGALKEGLAGGKFPSAEFGENAAWWWITVLSFNLNSIFKRLALPDQWITKKMKAIRFHFINLPARIIRHCRKLIVQFPKHHPSFKLLVDARRKIALLALPLLT